uniref:Uncharacterized protein AlNc14C13G1548 n=1 Tax=Albugo laibachii Nc14 TaxID=890382 RepID=F0W3I6_9STRA|nr:conserved hypothetical protein [Albugo laibachii Nc14]CCA16311.1 conserved hypothetical protein [Albugo laibachii Nc14]|eukprot:CCA16311.1 conserved hypothetical protein [Albugo laibachii Nc14]
MMEDNILNVSTDPDNNSASPLAESNLTPAYVAKMSPSLNAASHRHYSSSQAVSPLPLHLNREPANQLSIAGTMEQICINDASLSPQPCSNPGKICINDASLSPQQPCTNPDQSKKTDSLERTSEDSPTNTHINEVDTVDDSMQSSSETSQSLNNCKKARRELPPQTVALLKGWMLSPEHIKHPYPTDADKQILLKQTGLNMKQLTNWFTNARKRIWKPMMRQQQTKSMHDLAQFDTPFGPGPINVHRREPFRHFCGDKVYASNFVAPFESSNSIRQTFQPEVDQTRYSLNRGHCPPRNIRSMSESATANGWAALEYQQQCLRKRTYLQMGEQETVEREKRNCHSHVLPVRAVKILTDWVQSKLHSSSSLLPSSLYPTEAEILNFARQFDVSPSSIERWFDLRVASIPFHQEPRATCVAHHASTTNMTFPRNGSHRFLSEKISCIPSPNNPMFPSNSTSSIPFASSIPSKKNPLFPPPPPAERCDSVKSAFPFDNSQHTIRPPAKFQAGFSRADSSRSKLPALTNSNSSLVCQPRDARSHTLDMGVFADACRRKMNFQDVLASSTARLEIGTHTYPAALRHFPGLRQFTTS